MQTVKIPEDTKPWFECSINGKDYKYPAGATVSVPDDVAALIANINASNPKQAVPVPTIVVPKPTAANKVLKSNDALNAEWGEGGGGSGLPEFDENDDGKVLTVDEDELVWDDAPDGLPSIENDDDGKVLTVDGGEAKWITPAGDNVFVEFTVTVGAQGPVATTDAVFSDVVAAIAAGKNVIGVVLLGTLRVVASSMTSNPIENPTNIFFFAVADTSSYGDTPDPKLYRIIFTASGASASVTNLAVTT